MSSNIIDIVERIAFDAGRYLSYKDAAQKIDQLYRKQWISVDDRLPVSGKTILVWYRVTQLPYDTHVGISTYRGKLNGLITHWMPLPEPPIKQELQSDEP